VAVAVIRGDVVNAKIPRPRPQPSRPKTKAFKYIRPEQKLRYAERLIASTINLATANRSRVGCAHILYVDDILRDLEI